MEALFYTLLIIVAVRYYLKTKKEKHLLKLERASLTNEVNLLLHEKVQMEKEHLLAGRLKTYVSCIIVILFTKGSMTAQKVSFTKSRLESNMTIFVTQNRLEADLVVYKTADTSIRKPCVWITGFTRLESDLIIWETRVRREAEKVVYFTNNINETDCR